MLYQGDAAKFQMADRMRQAERARLAGSTSLYWQTHRTNATAMRLYDRVAERSEFLIYQLPLT